MHHSRYGAVKLNKMNKMTPFLMCVHLLMLLASFSEKQGFKRFGPNSASLVIGITQWILISYLQSIKHSKMT